MTGLADVLRRTAADHGTHVEVVDVTAGPTVDVVRVRPAAGVPVKRVRGLVESWSLAVGRPIRWAGLSGTSIALEVPREERRTVALDEVCSAGPSDAYGLSVPMGLRADGTPLSVLLDALPHLLVAGSTGQGKSVYVNALLVALLRQAGPDRLRLLLADPKRVELVAYADLPHLLAPVATDVPAILDMLRLAVDEMEARWQMMADAGVRHARDLDVPPPRLVVLVDELADVMLSAKKETERLVQALAQKGRAAGVHVVLATQRPSVDVVTGIVKANVPSRLCFTVASMTDSRVTLDANGAEALTGAGDGLLALAGRVGLERVQAPYVSDDEVALTVAQHVVRPAADEAPDVGDDREALRAQVAALQARVAAAEASTSSELPPSPAPAAQVGCSHTIHEVLSAELTEQTRREAFQLERRVVELEQALAIVLETLAAHGLRHPAHLEVPA